MRFSRLIVEEVKKRTEGKIAVLARINSTEDMFGGLDNHDMCAIASYLEDCGVDGLHVSRAVHLKDEYMWARQEFMADSSAELVANIKIVYLFRLLQSDVHRATVRRTDGKTWKS